MMACTIIIGTAGLGYFGAGWWTALIGALALTALSYLELSALRPRLAAVSGSYLFEAAVQARAGHSLLAAGAAYGWGALVRLVLW
jgi:hypothetical protein